MEASEPKGMTTMETIEEAIQSYKSTTGEWPTTLSGDATDYFGRQTTWSSIDKMLAVGFDGLTLAALCEGLDMAEMDVQELNSEDAPSDTDIEPARSDLDTLREAVAPMIGWMKSRIINKIHNREWPGQDMLAVYDHFARVMGVQRPSDFLIAYIGDGRASFEGRMGFEILNSAKAEPTPTT